MEWEDILFVWIESFGKFYLFQFWPVWILLLLYVVHIQLTDLATMAPFGGDMTFQYPIVRRLICWRRISNMFGIISLKFLRDHIIVVIGWGSDLLVHWILLLVLRKQLLWHDEPIYMLTWHLNPNVAAHENKNLKFLYLILFHLCMR